MNDFYIFVIDGSQYQNMYYQMLDDVIKNHNILIISEPNESYNNIKYLLLHEKVRRHIGNKLDFIGYEKSNLYKELCKVYSLRKYNNIIVIFFNSSFLLHQYVPYTLKKYKKEFPNVKYVLFYIDVIESAVSKFANTLRRENTFDLVYSFSKDEAKKIDCIPWHTLYSKKDYPNFPVNYDLYFCGASKQRLSSLLEIGQYAQEHHVSVNMDIICKEDEIENNPSYDGIHLRHADEFLEYSEVIANELKANCLLEVVESNQSSASLRSYEAICYNKKLLTNSIDILQSKFYNPEYIQYFENPSQIDWNWVKNDCEVQYHYHDEFSPINLIKDISTRLDSENCRG